MRYDFTKLSGLDFEELVHDLLQVSWSTALEIFKSGKDGGVDLRAFTGADRMIVQCKNFAGSSFSTLKARMREERAKLEKLALTRYVLVTSLPLTVSQKDDLLALLAPYVQNSTDVIGGTELEAMLDGASEVVKRHHKLWLTSTAVLERILHAAEHEQTRAHVERAARKLPLFVQTAAYGRALEALEQHRIVIVSGSPGIGKTTLADMLLYAHVCDGFTPAVIKTGLAEGRRLSSGSGPVIFHFDDFLGQTYLGDRPDFLGRKEDADLVDFIDWVIADGRHRFVLTTREHVLSDALQRSEKLRHHGLADERCVITVRDFKREQRARILYNHLYFSNLPLAYREEMLREDFFLEVVDCDEFNPRIVEWLASERRLRSVPTETYRDHVRALLENPQEIWRHAYTHELSQAARDVLLAVQSLSYLVVADDLELAFERLHVRSIARLNQRRVPGAWRAAMKELESSFLELKRGQIDFINPSVRDFMGSIIEADPSLALDVIAAAVRFNQLSGVWEGSKSDGPFPSVRQRVLDNAPLFSDACARLLEVPSLRWFDEPTGRIGRFIDPGMPSRAQFLLELQRIIPAVRPTAARAIELIALQLRKGELNISDVTGFLGATWKAREHGDWLAADPVFTVLDDELDHALAEDWVAMHRLRTAVGQTLDKRLPRLMSLYASYQSTGALREQSNASGRSAYEDLKYNFEQLQEKHGANLAYEISQVEQALTEIEDDEEEHEPVRPDAGHLSFEDDGHVEDEDLREMFRTLVGQG